MVKRFLFAALLLITCAVCASAYDFMVDGIAYSVNRDGTSVRVTYQNNVATNAKDPRYLSLSGSLTIPPTVSYVGMSFSVTSIDDAAFAYCTGLTSVNICTSVTTIGKDAFKGCTGLTNVNIPVSVTKIGNYAFSGCRGLTSVVWNAKNCNDFVSSVPDDLNYVRSFYSPFKDLTSIKSFTFGREVEKIPAGLCYGLSGLTSVTIPNSVTEIGNYVFLGCTGLTSVVWNAKKCKDFSFDHNPFKYSTNIMSFKFGSEVEKIPAYLCDRLKGLTSITIPNSVNKIGYVAFASCTGLTRINAYPNPAKVAMSGYVFDDVPKNVTLHVLPKYLSAYQTASQWKDFYNIIGDLTETDGIEEVSIDELDRTLPMNVYNMNGVKMGDSLEGLPAGIYIVHQGSKSAKVMK